MNADITVEILKQAILLEKQGQAFYSQVAGQASGKAVKQFFEMMAAEEAKHVKILSDQFKVYKNNSQFAPEAISDDHSEDVATNVLTREMKNEISAADYEAVDLQKRATDPNAPGPGRLQKRTGHLSGRGRFAVLLSGTHRPAPAWNAVPGQLLERMRGG